MEPALKAPWQLCDDATRTAIVALHRLNQQRQHAGMSIETLAARSGLSLCTATRAMHGLGCNLAEFLCLAAALSTRADNLIGLAARDATITGEAVTNRA